MPICEFSKGIFKDINSNNVTRTFVLNTDKKEKYLQMMVLNFTKDLNIPGRFAIRTDGQDVEVWIIRTDLKFNVFTFSYKQEMKFTFKENCVFVEGQISKNTVIRSSPGGWAIEYFPSSDYISIGQKNGHNGHEYMGMIKMRFIEHKPLLIIGLSDGKFWIDDEMNFINTDLCPDLTEYWKMKYTNPVWKWDGVIANTWYIHQSVENLDKFKNYSFGSYGITKLWKNPDIMKPLNDELKSYLKQLDMIR